MHVGVLWVYAAARSKTLEGEVRANSLTCMVYLE
jgi:hypothetical protein